MYIYNMTIVIKQCFTIIVLYHMGIREHILTESFIFILYILMHTKIQFNSPTQHDWSFPTLHILIFLFYIS